jgi:hypothetical protein
MMTRNQRLTPTLTLQLFGAPRLELSSQPVPLERRKAMALLAYLAVTVTRQPQPRDTLAALFWPEANASEARAALRRALSVLNTSLSGEALEAQRDTIAVTARDLWVDVLAFRTLLAETAAHHTSGEPPCGQCLIRLSDAAELYRGDFMAGFTKLAAMPLMRTFAPPWSPPAAGWPWTPCMSPPSAR